MNALLKITLPSLALILMQTSALAAHVYGGITDTNNSSNLDVGDALAFVNQSTGVAITGASFGLQEMSSVSVGVQNGLFMTSGISFTGLSNGLSFNGATYRSGNPFAATSGSLLQLRIVDVTGPLGAEFSFWDTHMNPSGPTETFTIGTTSETNPWNLTDLSLSVGDGVSPTPTGTNNPPTDPYGHLHGRSFTVDTAGSYTVTYLLTDASGNQPDSAPFVVDYSTVPEPGVVALFVLAAIASIFVIRLRRSA